MEACPSFFPLRTPAFDEGSSEDGCPLFAIWLWFTHNYNIRGHVLLQVKRELGIGKMLALQSRGRPGFSRQVVGTVELVEVDLDAAPLTGLLSDRDYVS